MCNYVRIQLLCYIHVHMYACVYMYTRMHANVHAVTYAQYIYKIYIVALAFHKTTLVRLAWTRDYTNFLYPQCLLG